MPAELINIRSTVTAGQGTRTYRKITKSGYLDHGYVHFPAGCNALVLVLVAVEKGGSLVPVAPIPDTFTNTKQYIALNDYTLPFRIDMEISAGDQILVEIQNTDASNPHTISILSQWLDKKPGD